MEFLMQSTADTEALISFKAQDFFQHKISQNKKRFFFEFLKSR
jgi:hypothetical protein